MYALMKANLFVHFPGHVIKYWEEVFGKRRKKTIGKYLKLQGRQGTEQLMIAWKYLKYLNIEILKYLKSYS